MLLKCFRMGFSIMNGFFARYNQLSGSFRQILYPRLSVVSVDRRGAKISVEEKLNLPAKPKKPLTPFFHFMKQIRASTVEENPGIKLTEISRKIAKKWESVDPKLKKEYEVQFEKENEQYIKAKLKYEQNLTDEQKESIKKAKLEMLETKQKRQLKQKAKVHSRPKRPGSSYVLFSLSRMGQRGDKSVADLHKEISKEWKQLDKNEKNKFKDEADKNYQKYLKDLKEWEEEMIKLGHVDIVRTASLVPKVKSKK